MEKIKKWLDEKTTSASWRRIWLGVVVGGIAMSLLFGGLYAYGSSFEDRIHPGIHIGEIAVGGMTKEEIKSFLQDMSEKLINDGLEFTFQINNQSKSVSLYPVIVTDGSVIDLVSIDIDKEVERLMNYGKGNGRVTAAMSAIYSQLAQPKLGLESVRADKDRIIEELAEEVGEFEKAPKNANVVVDSIDPLVYKLSTSSEGLVFRYDQVVGHVTAAWTRLEAPVLEVKQEVVEPVVRIDDVNVIEERLPDVFAAGSLTINYTDPTTARDKEWFITSDLIKDWLEVQKTPKEDFVFGLDREKVEAFVEENISESVGIEARDAKFEISPTGKVVEFQGSRPGVTVDLAMTYDYVNQAIVDRTLHDDGLKKSIQLAVQTVDPNVATGAVNDLGIKEVLGSGISDFSGSPANRIKNIRNAVNKLNGILVKPDEEFSTLDHTRPFTLEGGYLPELVIKGDEIKPEIGGGLCQIGTTLFRMAMNSGMPITERRNHSLVVHYYNDLENGLPGTDATLYDSSPDFRFKNDTGNHILVQTDMNVRTGLLTFTLWGTSDGRKGHYEKPVVKRWIPHGETKIIKTTKLEPGERECQHAYTGAEAAFSYIRELPDGTQEEQVFESYYRPLPEICLVGVTEDEINQCQELPDGSSSCSSGGTEEASVPENVFNPDGSITPIIPE